jgi:membrane-anchored protein YejM (alkaline phosphatase superfamily)
MAKKITLAILMVLFAIGCIGSWFEVFDMDAFTKFLIHFSPFYLGLVASIGTNSAVEKIKGGQ